MGYSLVSFYLFYIFMDIAMLCPASPYYYDTVALWSLIRATAVLTKRMPTTAVPVLAKNKLVITVDPSVPVTVVGVADNIPIIFFFRRDRSDCAVRQVVLSQIGIIQKAFELAMGMLLWRGRVFAFDKRDPEKDS